MLPLLPSRPRTVALEKTPPSGVAGSKGLNSLVRQYKNFACYESGWAVFQTKQVRTDRGATNTSVTFREHDIAVPLEEFLAYFRNIDAVVNLIETTTDALVARYNALEVKKGIEWNETICKQVWVGRGGKEETSLFYLNVQTYDFFLRTQASLETRIATEDLKVRRRLN